MKWPTPFHTQTYRLMTQLRGISVGILGEGLRATTAGSATEKSQPTDVPIDAALALLAANASEALGLTWEVTGNEAVAYLGSFSVASVVYAPKPGKDPFRVVLEQRPAAAKLCLAALHGVTLLGVR